MNVINDLRSNETSNASLPKEEVSKPSDHSPKISCLNDCFNFELKASLISAKEIPSDIQTEYTFKGETAFFKKLESSLLNILHNSYNNYGIFPYNDNKKVSKNFIDFFKKESQNELHKYGLNHPTDTTSPFIQLLHHDFPLDNTPTNYNIVDANLGIKDNLSNIFYIEFKLESNANNNNKKFTIHQINDNCVDREIKFELNGTYHDHKIFKNDLVFTLEYRKFIKSMQFRIINCLKIKNEKSIKTQGTFFAKVLHNVNFGLIFTIPSDIKSIQTNFNSIVNTGITIDRFIIELTIPKNLFCKINDNIIKPENVKKTEDKNENEKNSKAEQVIFSPKSVPKNAYNNNFTSPTKSLDNNYNNNNKNLSFGNLYNKNVRGYQNVFFQDNVNSANFTNSFNNKKNNGNYYFSSYNASPQVENQIINNLNINNNFNINKNNNCNNNSYFSTPIGQRSPMSNIDAQRNYNMLYSPKSIYGPFSPMQIMSYPIYNKNTNCCHSNSSFQNNSNNLLNIMSPASMSPVKNFEENNFNELSVNFFPNLNLNHRKYSESLNDNNMMSNQFSNLNNDEYLEYDQNFNANFIRQQLLSPTTSTTSSFSAMNQDEKVRNNFYNANPMTIRQRVFEFNQKQHEIEKINSLLNNTSIKGNEVEENSEENIIKNSFIRTNSNLTNFDIFIKYITPVLSLRNILKKNNKITYQSNVKLKDILCKFKKVSLFGLNTTFLYNNELVNILFSLSLSSLLIKITNRVLIARIFFELQRTKKIPKGCGLDEKTEIYSNQIYYCIYLTLNSVKISFNENTPIHFRPTLITQIFNIINSVPLFEKITTQDINLKESFFSIMFSPSKANKKFNNNTSFISFYRFNLENYQMIPEKIHDKVNDNHNDKMKLWGILPLKFDNNLYLNKVKFNNFTIPLQPYPYISPMLINDSMQLKSLVYNVLKEISKNQYLISYDYENFLKTSSKNLLN